MAVSERHLRDLIPEIKEMIDSTTAGLNANIPPEPTKGGAGGSYYMHDAQRKPVAVFKPLDEERSAVNNPEQQQSEGSFVESTPEGLKKGTKAGKGGYREAAAYRLDHPISGRRLVSRPPTTFGFAGVPPTAFGTCRSVHFKNEGAVNAKPGSLQKYMENDGDCRKEKIDPDKYIVPDEYKKFPTDEVHKIAVLDIRFANADRHGGNILRSKSNSVLIPIDHGYCFPKSFGGGRFCWLDWPQAKEQFSDETRNYIKELDAEEDILLMKSYGWNMPPDVARVFRVSTMLLQEGVKKDLTPHAIGKTMCKPRKRDPSKIERIFDKASKEYPSEKDDDKFIEVVSKAIDTLLDKIATKIDTPS